MKSLGPKLLKILESVGSVGKSGYNEHQEYKYTTEADVLEAVKKALIENKVFVAQSSRITDVKELTNDKGKKSLVTSVETINTFIDTESGETYSVNSVGQGHDSHDKGVFKALTGANKYFLMKNLMISTGDDPEKTSSEGGAKKTNEKSDESSSSNGSFGSKKKAAPAAEATASKPAPAASSASSGGFGSRPKPAATPPVETKAAEVTNDPVPAAAKPANSGFGAKKEDSKPSGFGSKTKAPAAQPPKADPEF